jgi:NAD(P)-dependent dehydrogenase (short-subunit alcohol dehydrogenase family)
LSKKNFENQVIVITGASSGIGRATACAFARAGAQTVLVSRSKAKLDRVAEDIRTHGGHALVVPADVSSSESVAAAVSTIVDELGGIDILFNNAGKSFVGRTDQPDFAEKTRDLFETDYLGTVRMTQAVVPIMKKRGHGHILNMSSVVGRKSFPGFGGYSSVMHAIDGYTSALRQELKGTGIDVSIIHPALTQTPLLANVQPEDMPAAFRRLSPISVEQVADAALNGIRRSTARIVVPWQPRLLMLADAISPQLGDRFVTLLQNPVFGRLTGTYRGGTYQHLAT